MEERALEMLKTILARRKLDTKTTPIAAADLAGVNLYTIGDILVIFSQKDKVSDRDIPKFKAFAEANEYGHGIIIVGLSPPSQNVLQLLKTLAKERIQYFHIRELQFDITTHRYSMPHRIITEDEKTKLVETFKITRPADQLPSIDSYDIQARLLGAVPGDIIEVLRHSDSAGQVPYFRYCVEDVNIA